MAPELFIALGAVSPSLFAELWRAQSKDPRIWPLTTTAPSAVAAARRSLGRDVLGLLEDGRCSVGELIEAVTLV